MKCTHCNKREATTHIERIINGKKEEMYLCDECAKELGVMDEFNFEPFSAVDSLFGNLLGAGAAALNTLTGIDRCTDCGSSWNDIVNTGLLGCAECYDRFADRLEPSIEQIHGRTKHVGKTISYTEEKDDADQAQSEEPEKKADDNSVEGLKAQLKEAIKEQRFEDAAVIRDKIKALGEEDK